MWPLVPFQPLSQSLRLAESVDSEFLINDAVGSVLNLRLKGGLFPEIPDPVSSQEVIGVAEGIRSASPLDIGGER